MLLQTCKFPSSNSTDKSKQHRQENIYSGRLFTIYKYANKFSNSFISDALESREGTSFNGYFKQNPSQKCRTFHVCATSQLIAFLD